MMMQQQIPPPLLSDLFGSKLFDMGEIPPPKRQMDLTLEVGCMLYRHVRKMVEKANFDGHPIRVFEGSGWLSREFVFRGSEPDVRAVGRWFDHLRQQELE